MRTEPSASTFGYRSALGSVLPMRIEGIPGVSFRVLSVLIADRLYLWVTDYYDHRSILFICTGEEWRAVVGVHGRTIR